MTVSKPRIVVTHWVHPKVTGYRHYDERRFDARTEETPSVSCQSLEQKAEISDVLIAALPLTSRTGT